MPWKPTANIELSEKQEKILNKSATGTLTPMHLKTRAQIILMAGKGWSNNTIEENLHIWPKTVECWRDRYSFMSEELKQTETETPHKIRSTVEKILSDEQRPGGPSKFTDEQAAANIAMACEDPAGFELPFSHWTPELLQIEVLKLGIVESISVRQIGRFLKRTGFKAAPEPMLAEP